jgi:uncharacterized lipoprotein YddW (UPF0748 family)
MTPRHARGRAAVVLLALAAAPVSAAPREELRGLWVVRTALVSPRAVDAAVDDAVEGGFNALFVQVRGRGDAFYDSALVPRSVLLERQPRDFDPLSRLIARARSRKLQVHAWVNVLLAAHFGQPLPRGHVLAVHPEWAMVPRPVAAAALAVSGPRRLRLIAEEARGEGDAEGYYLSPSIPAVADHLERVIRELVRGYRLDGLHLDFIRYPGPAWDYSRAALEGFRGGGRGRDLLDAPAREPSAWDGYRRGVLTALAARLARAARAERRGLVLSAAVVPDEAQAITQKFQDWPRWLETEVLEALCPMTYTPDNQLFQAQVEQARARARGQPVWAGIGAYRMDLAGVVEKVVLARQSGAAGFLIFSNESFAPGELRRLREEVFASRAAVLPASSGGGWPAGAR